VTDAHSQLDELTDQLEQAAARLRSGDLGADAAAQLVDECARLAARAGAELEREAGAVDVPPGQDTLI
jgi:hypothetical protein